MATFLVVDKKYSLTMEIKDDLKESFDESIGLSVYSTGDFIVEGDKGRLAQVLSNFISNAIKFTSNGNIDIFLEKSQDGKTVLLSVKDTGYGIDPDIMPRLFTKFTTRSDADTGLGL